MDVIHTGGGPTVDVQAQQTANEDVVAAMKWLRTLPEVDEPDRGLGMLLRRDSNAVNG